MQIFITGANRGLGLVFAETAPGRGRGAKNRRPPIHRRVWETGNSACEESVYYFRRFDPNREKHEEVFHRTGHIAIYNFPDRIRTNVLWADVLWVTGLKDTVRPPSPQFAAYNKIRT